MKKRENSTLSGSSLESKAWKRFIARLIDSLLLSIGLALMLAIFDPTLLSDLDVMFGFVVLAIWVMLEPVFLSTLGTTFGKWLFNISIRDVNNNKLSFLKAFKRSFLIWFKGLAMGLPIISLVAQFAEYKNLTKKGETSWDQQENFIVICNKLSLVKIMFILMLIISYCYLWIHFNN